MGIGNVTSSESCLSAGVLLGPGAFLWLKLRGNLSFLLPSAAVLAHTGVVKHATYSPDTPLANGYLVQVTSMTLELT